MNFKKVLFITLFIILIFNILALADEHKLPNPSDMFYVYDEGNILDDNLKKYIVDVNEELYKKTGAQIVVVDLKSLKGNNLEQTATDLFRNWGIGSKDDNGVLLLIVLDEKLIRIEVGYGLEGAIPDSKAGSILDNYIEPYFKKGDYNNGVYNGFNEILKLVEKEYNIKVNLNENVKIPEPIHDVSANYFQKLLIGFILLIFIIIDFRFFGGIFTYSLIRIASRGEFNNSGKSNRGGGGSSGGGGVSGGW